MVLYNDAINLAHIHTPEMVLGGMLGNIGVRVPINVATGEVTGPATTVFREGDENPDAANPLPRDIFTGAFYERWGPVPEEGYIKHVYAGRELRQASHAMAVLHARRGGALTSPHPRRLQPNFGATGTAPPP
jgi:hypothetical protein